MAGGGILAGRYRLLQKTAEGGMGAVYEAVEMTTGETVAVKTWRAAARPSERLRARFRKEALALSRVQHPAIARYLDHGESDEYGPFVVMAWVPGQTLAQRLDTTGITPRGALALGQRLAAGLTALHALGVVHRDLKPSNVLLPGGDPSAAILVDLGVARLADATEATQTGGPIGTPRYMAPEQIRNLRSIDGKADVFGLGCVLFECLTGRVAFEGSDPVSILSRVLFDPLPVPSRVRAELPSSVDGLVAALLARDPGRRPSAAMLEGLFAGFDAAAELPAGVARAHWNRDGAAFESEDETGLESVRTVSHAPPSLRAPGTSERTPAPSTLPPFDGDFVGRDDERRELVALLVAHTPVVTVWGPAGVGKSRLVCHAVERAMAEGARPWDVVVYADLESAGDADDVVRIVAREAKVRLDSSETPEVALARALSRLGRVLLVLDPVEHVASALSAALLVFQRLAHDVQVLATSRSRFSPAGAVTVELGPLATAAEGGVSPAAALVLARARSFLSTFGAAPESDASGETVALAERLATLLDGIPLAIELTVSRIHLLGLRGLVDAVESRRARKTPSDRTLTTMSETLDRSWLLLSEDEQRALSACAVFRGGFTVDAATAVLGAQTSEDALAPLLRLREQSLLLSRDEGDGKVRLFLSGAVHDYALEKLSEHGESAAWFARHGAHYAARFFAERGRVDAVHLSLVEREAENLLAAAERGLEGDGVAIADAARGLVALEPAVFARGAVSAFAALLDRAVDIADASTSALSDPTVTIPVRQIRARLDAVSGRLGRARHDLEKSLEESQRIADDPLRGAVLLDLGVVHHFEQDLPAARARYEAALPLLRQANDAASEGRCVGNLGALQHDEGAFSLAARSYRHAIALLESVGESPRRANFITNLALLEHELDRLESARRLYEQALSLLESLRNARLLGIALGNFALLEIELGNRADALELCERSSRLLAGLADTRSEALAAARQGVVLSLSERLGEAEMALSRAEHLASGTVTAEVVACARAFLDIGWARAARDAAELLECLQLARARLERASVAQGGERPLRERSDDVRLLLRIALPLLEALTPAR